MDYSASQLTNNLIQRDEVFVYDYNQVPGDNFQVFYLEQAPTMSSPSRPTTRMARRSSPPLPRLA